VQYCVQQLCTVQCTHVWTDLTVACWLDLAFWDYFVLLCMCAFVVLDLDSSVLLQDIGWEERLWNDLFCVKWGVKPWLSQSSSRWFSLVVLSASGILQCYDTVGCVTGRKSYSWKLCRLSTAAIETKLALVENTLQKCYLSLYLVPLVLWCCWLGIMTSIRPVKNVQSGDGVVFCLEQGANNFHVVQLMPPPPCHLLLR